MSGYVYLLHNWSDGRDLYKIGVSKHEDVINNRIKELQTGNPYEILLVNKYKCQYYRKVENMLHHHYCNNNERGEWFELTVEQINDFISKCEYFDRCVNLLKKENPFYK